MDPDISAALQQSAGGPFITRHPTALLTFCSHKGLNEMMNQLTMIAFFMALFIGKALALDDTSTEIERLKAENALLKQRVQQLEMAVGEIRQMLGKSEAVTRAVPPAPAPLYPKPSVQFYGQVEMDTTYDTNQINWSDPSQAPSGIATIVNDEDFNLSAAPSRIGMRVQGPAVGSAELSGKLETDFFSGAGGPNSPHLRLRHAFMKMDWLQKRFGILIGQTYDVIAPLQTDSINWPLENWTGDVGYRRPQIQVSQWFQTGRRSRLLFQGAFCRSIGPIYNPKTSTEDLDAGLPTIQGRMAFEWPLGGTQTNGMGLWGHWGQEKFRQSPNESAVDLKSWSIGMDANLFLTPQLRLMTELWKGAFVNAFQGDLPVLTVNQGRLLGVQSTGGWATLTMGPWNGLRFNIGGGFDDPLNQDLNKGDRSLTATYFGNFFYDPNASLEIGLELSHWQTRYIDKTEGDDFRLQNCFIYKF